MRRIWVFALAASACGGQGPVVMAGPGTASGTVTRDGKPASNVSLSLVGPNGGTRVKTNSAGSWSASGLPDGEYSFYYSSPAAEDQVVWWRGPKRRLANGGAVAFAEIDIGHHGVPRSPDPGARLAMPAIFEWTPYPGATDYGFQVMDKIGSDAKVLFRPVVRFKGDTTRIVYDGGVNVHDARKQRMKDYLGVMGDFLLPGSYSWSAVWSTQDAGDGQGPARPFSVDKLEPEIFPKESKPSPDRG